MTHEQLYKKIGVRKLDNFINPILLTDTDFTFPVRSEFSWFKISPVVESPKKELGYLVNSKKPVVITKYKYDSPIGNFKSKESTIDRVIKEQRKLNPDFTYLKSNVKKIKISKDILLIHSYGAIAAVHTYRASPTMLFDRWRNGFNTLISNLTTDLYSVNRHKYVLLDLPFDIPNKTAFEKCVDADERTILKYFPTGKHLTLLEIWKFLTPEVMKDTMLFKLKNAMLDNITFLAVYNNKVTLLNLKTLLSTVKEYGVNSNIDEQPATTIRKMFLIWLMKIKTGSSVDLLNVDSDDDIKISHLTNNETKNNEVDVNAVLSDFDDDMVDEIDYNKISDDLITDSSNNDVIDDVNSNVTKISEINTYTDNKIKLKDQVEILKENKLLSKRDIEIVEEALENQKTSANPYGDTKDTLEEMLTVKDEDILLPEDLVKIPNINIIDNPDMLKDPIKAMDKHYLDKVYHKDILSVIYSLQDSDIIIKNHEVEIEDSVLGGIEIHTMEVKPLTGKPSKLTFRIPVIEEDGTFKLSGNIYNLRKQRAAVPLSKMSPTKVVMSTYYGKSFITKSDFKKDQVGYWFRNKLIAAAESNRKISNLVFMPIKLMDVKTPLLYSNLAQYVKMFKIGNIKYSFDYNNRNELLLNDKLDIKVIENGKYVLCGKDVDSMIVMDFNNVLYRYKNKKYTMIDSMFTQLNIDISTMPVENISIKVFKQRIPVVVLLAYYIGIDNLFKLLKTKHTIIGRTERYTVALDEYVIVFKDKKIIFKRNDGINSLIFGGLKTIHKELKDIELVLLNSKKSFPVIFNSMGLPPLYVNEIRIMEDMFVDPITRTILKSMKLPETFKGLLIESAEMLLNNDYKNPNDSSLMLIKGHERIAGMIYGELVNSVRDFENKNTFSKAKMTMDPFSIWRKLNDDSTVMLADDLNPIASLKSSEDLSMLGSGGLSKDAVSQDKRIFNASEVGVISEGVKDSGDVGTSAYMSANPRITNARGMVSDKSNKNLDASNIFSTTALLSPSGDRDDGKRLINNLVSAYRNICKNKNN